MQGHTMYLKTVNTAPIQWSDSGFIIDCSYIPVLAELVEERLNVLSSEFFHLKEQASTETIDWNAKEDQLLNRQENDRPLLKAYLERCCQWRAMYLNERQLAWVEAIECNIGALETQYTRLLAFVRGWSLFV